MKSIINLYKKLYAKNPILCIILSLFSAFILIHALTVFVVIMAFLSPAAILFLLILRGAKGFVEDYCNEETEQEVSSV